MGLLKVFKKSITDYIETQKTYNQIMCLVPCDNGKKIEKILLRLKTKADELARETTYSREFILNNMIHDLKLGKTIDEIIDSY